MKKVLRYELDEFLAYINEHDSVFDNRADAHVECNVVFVIEGKYKVLIDNYICDAELIDGVVIAFRDTEIYLDPMYYDMERRCMAYNDRLYLHENPTGFIDEFYILGATEEVDEPRQNSVRLESIAKRINTENLSDIEKVEMLMETYEEELHPFIKY